MKRYDEYKDSGVQWLGEIPGHWRRCYISRIIKGIQDGTHGSFDRVDSGEPLLSAKNVTEKGIDISQNESLISYDNYTCIVANGYPQKGDIAFCSVGSVGKCCMYTFEKSYAFQRSVTFLRVKKDYKAQYLLYTLKSNICLLQYNALLKKSAIGGIYMGDIKRICIFYPPLAEQQSIVTYLDEKCRLIDKMLEGKQKQIDLLAETKQRVIADAVTRGLNPDVKTKTTNIPWLPEIPEHWEETRAKNLFNKEQRPIQDSDEIVTCFRDGEVTLRKNRRTTGFTEATDYSHYQHICKGDLVIHQMDAFAGSSGVSDSDGMGTPVLSVCTAKSDDVLNEYYAHILRLMGKNGFILSLYRGIRERSSDFRFDTFSKQWLPVPPLAEQQAIVAHINERTAKIDLLATKLKSEIEAIKEYKQRLISDVVTGQIKVC